MLVTPNNYLANLSTNVPPVSRQQGETTISSTYKHCNLPPSGEETRHSVSNVIP